MSSPIENPFEPPVGKPDHGPEDGLDSPEKVLLACKRPGTALLIMGSIHAVFPAIAVVSELFKIGSDVFSPIALFWFCIYLFSALMISIGGAKMAFMESYSMARWGAILACIPVISPFLIWGIPFGIWALIVLKRPRVKDAFEAKVTAQ